METYALACAAWLAYASGVVFAGCMKVRDGMSMARWEGWKVGLERIEMGIGEEERQSMRKAIVGMGKAGRRNGKK